MVEWMREVLKVFKSPDETFYQAVTIMDRYFDQKRTSLHLEELHEVGIASIFIASKNTELEPLTLDLMQRKASHGKITEATIKKREMDMLNTLKFKVACPSLKECVDSFLAVFSSQFRVIDSCKDSIASACERLMETATLNFRFSFEMKPTQLAICIIRLSVLSVESQNMLEILDDVVISEMRSHHIYSKGKMNGIEKRLT
jgi:hypothetical protein